MTELSKLDHSVKTMTSREIAELVEKRHDNVKRTVSDLANAGVISYPQIEDGKKAANGVVETVYLLEKRDSFIVVAQLSPEFTARLVDRWQELESQAATAIPQTLSAALRLAADQAEQIERQQALLAIAAPKAAFVDYYVESTGLKGFRQVAKLLNANEARLREFMIDKKIMYRLGGEWAAYQPHIESGRFDVKTGANPVNKHAYTRTLFTSKGVEWLAGLWAVYCLNSGAAMGEPS